ncbi:MAG: glutamate--cysteine ligase [Lamprobacter sp.]|uniref:glutamate--cysteine ligase n=1 Tax=Lamprobacter sp. TaxID=3100796 RepID=UPI002B25FB6C|nr:glutamate--cysteine ligase [Lamprobacter sp.]MEA3638653.1 glutamate--cysteine ligase [Lamprobacter sp.]
MGQDIQHHSFTEADFREFEARLQAETALLERWFAEDAFADCPRETGFELEAWLIDRRHQAPAPVIDALLEQQQDPLILPELARFNLELNSTPVPLNGQAFRRLHAELERTLAHSQAAAATLNAQVGTIGILPTVRPDHLVPAQMTPRPRYRALNEQILRLRDGEPFRLAIEGERPLFIEQPDVMLESAATSFQIHFKIGAAESARVFNASKLLAAITVAIGANSPYLFGRDLWCETRIPLFEQAVSVGDSPLRERVGFGIRYAERSVMECFRSNITRYPVILPHLMDEPVEQFAHLRLHNGTIWRWNRPLIGWEARPNTQPRPHLRMEHRVIAAGPSTIDNIANAAFYCGAVQALSQESKPPEQGLPFNQARINFYLAARHGLKASILWCGSEARMPIHQLIVQQILPMARRGLSELGIDRDEIDDWLGVIEARARTRRTGAAWQRAWVAKHGPDMAALTEAYLIHQASGKPVHEWTLD